MSPPYLHLSINLLNPVWHEENVNYDMAFNKVVNFAYDILKGMVVYNQGVELAIEECQMAINNAENPDYIILKRFCPWQETG